MKELKAERADIYNPSPLRFLKRGEIVVSTRVWVRGYD